MLKSLFSSNTRVKILKIFLLNPEEEFFIRELTRRLDEQINSVRRELDNLKKIGLLRSRSKNRKKYYHLNTNFVIYHELKSIITKAVNSETNISKAINNMGEIELLVISGKFVDNKESKIDILIIGQVNKTFLENYLQNELNKEDVRYSIISKQDFIYRLSLKDRFILDIITDHRNIFAINKLKKHLP